MDDEKLMGLLNQIFLEIKEIKSGQLHDRESIELIAAQTELLTANFDRLETEVNGLKTEVKDIKEIVVRIENEHGNKINALFDGHLQNKEKIAEHDRILRNR